ncbi:MAG: energy transducer TonB [Acetobacter sp.]|nr:energy transducer TonB [Acetobacter sp.]
MTEDESQNVIQCPVSSGVSFRMGVLLFVIFLHIPIIVILAYGTRSNVKPIVRLPPVRVTILPPPPPPPPPKIVVPPPPFIPPPKIVVPPPPKPPMRHITHKFHKVPLVPQRQTEEVPPVSAATSNAPPDVLAGDVPLNNVQPVYPPEMEEDNIEGRVVLVCDVDTTGKTSNCSVRSFTGGQAFVTSALDYVHRARYRPAMRNGVPVKELHKVYIIRYKLD